MTIGRIPSVEGGIQPTIVDAKGDLIVATAADTVSRLAVGSANQVLTVDSSTATGLKWAAPGSLIKISSTSFTAQASQAFDGIFTSSYSSYLIIIEELFTSTANNSMRFQWRYAGPTTQTTAYYNGFTGGSTTGSNFAGGGVANGAHLQISTNVGNQSSQALRGYVKVFGCSGSSKIPHATYQTSNGYDGTTANGGGWVNSEQVYTGFILTAAAGNITGTITIYGTAA